MLSKLRSPIPCLFWNIYLLHDVYNLVFRLSCSIFRYPLFQPQLCQSRDQDERGFFLKNNNFLRQFCPVRVKSHFPLLSQVFNFSRLSVFALSSKSETIENKEVLSVINFTFDFILVTKSFMYIRKKLALKQIFMVYLFQFCIPSLP